MSSWVDADHDVFVQSALKISTKPVKDTVHFDGECLGSEPGVVHGTVLWSRRVVESEEGLRSCQLTPVLKVIATSKSQFTCARSAVFQIFGMAWTCHYDRVVVLALYEQKMRFDK